MCGGFVECELYVVFAARIVWLQCVVSLVLVSDMAGKLEDLQTGLAKVKTGFARSWRH